MIGTDPKPSGRRPHRSMSECLASKKVVLFFGIDEDFWRCLLINLIHLTQGKPVSLAWPRYSNTKSLEGD